MNYSADINIKFHISTGSFVFGKGRFDGEVKESIHNFVSVGFDSSFIVMGKPLSTNDRLIFSFSSIHPEIGNTV